MEFVLSELFSMGIRPILAGGVFGICGPNVSKSLPSEDRPTRAPFSVQTALPNFVVPYPRRFMRHKYTVVHRSKLLKGFRAFRIDLNGFTYASYLTR